MENKMANKILIADDEASIRELYKRVINKDKKYEIDEAANGQDALTLFEQNLYALVISDNLMPIMDGIESTSKMKKIAKEKGIETRVILISGTLQDKPSHVDYLFSKPIDIMVLKDTVNKAYKEQNTEK